MGVRRKGVGGGQVGAVSPLTFSGLIIIIITDDFNVQKNLKMPKQF